MMLIINVAAVGLLLLLHGYVLFLCISAIRRLRVLTAAASPLAILNAVAASRRHYGFHALLSFVVAGACCGAKAAAVVGGHYGNATPLTQLAFGSTSDDIVARFGIVGCVLIGLAIIQAIFVIRYDAYLRMLFVLRKSLGLELKLTEKPV